MYCLSCVSITKPLALASIPNDDSPPIQTTHAKPAMHRPKPTTPPKRRQQAQEQNRLKRQQPSISQIERAIGAGRYRDIDARHVPLLPCPQIQHPLSIYDCWSCEERFFIWSFVVDYATYNAWNFEVSLFQIIRELEEEEKSKFDYISMSFSGKFEGPVEKRLRETGERLSNWTESGFRASGNNHLAWFLLLVFLGFGNEDVSLVCSLGLVCVIFDY